MTAETTAAWSLFFLGLDFKQLGLTQAEYTVPSLYTRFTSTYSFFSSQGSLHIHLLLAKRFLGPQSGCAVLEVDLSSRYTQCLQGSFQDSLGIQCIQWIPQAHHHSACLKKKHIIHSRSRQEKKYPGHVVSTKFQLPKIILIGSYFAKFIKKGVSMQSTVFPVNIHCGEMSSTLELTPIFQLLQLYSAHEQKLNCKFKEGRRRWKEEPSSSKNRALRP